MDYYIRIVDGQPYEHPIAGDNFRAAFPNVDENNLPADFAGFIRIDPTTVTLKPYEFYIENYVWDGDVVSDDWQVGEVPPEEKATMREAAYAEDHPEGYIFNEEWFVWEPDLNAPGSAPDVVS